MSNGIVFGRAYNCSYCYEFWMMGSDEIIDYADESGIAYWEPAKGQAVWPTIQATLLNGNCFVHMAHSNATIMGGDNTGLGYMIAESNATSISALNSKAVYSFSCRAAQSILPAILADGALAVGGFDEDYWFYLESSYLDDYFQSTMAGGFEFARSIIADRTWQQCYTDTIAKFNAEYARWVSGDLKNKPYASNIAAVILEDRDALWIDGDTTWHLLGGAAVGTITVSANIAAASYTITGPATYSGSGTSYSVSNAPAGDYTIAYGAVVGYATPANETLTLAEGGTISFTGTYAAEATTGTINVSTNLPGATFALTGPATYSGSGVFWSQAGALTGKYTITFGVVTGYTTPASQSLTLISGATISFQGEYLPEVEEAAVPTVRKTSPGQTQVLKYPFLNWKFVQFECTNNYVTGGYNFDVDGHCPFKVGRVLPIPYGGYTCEVDKNTNKLIVIRGGNEVNNGTDLTGVSFMLICFGFIGWSGDDLEPTAHLQVPGGTVTPIFIVTPATTIEAGETTFDVTGINEVILNNQSPTTINEITGMIEGQHVNINIEDAGYTTIEHNDLIRLKDKENFRGYEKARLCLWFDGECFREVN